MRGTWLHPVADNEDFEGVALPLRPAARDASFADLLGESPPFVAAREEMALALEVDYPVLVRGETGTGKDLVASLLHEKGRRAAGPLIVLNSAAIPDSLVESQLFGHRRGAFTGADRDAPGLFDAARGGTLFLDELHQLSLTCQSKLLRAVETGDYMPLGTGRAQRSDARLVFATNANLVALVEKGLFRADLYYRIHVLTIDLPALRDVRSDIPRLVAHFVGRIRRRLGGPVPAVTPAALAALVAAPWPGNVRQLIHELERALLRCKGGELGTEHLSPALRPQGCASPRPATLEMQREDITRAWERETLERGLVRTHWNITRLADELGLSRRGLTGKLARHGLRRAGAGALR